VAGTEYKCMPCYHPLTAYRSEGKVVFNSPFVYAKGFNLPCGQCVGCRLNYSRQWAIRLVHEAQMHEHKSFITLTFNPESLNNRDVPQSLDVRDFQLFMKKLRKKHKNKKTQILPLRRIWRRKQKTALPCFNIRLRFPRQKALVNKKRYKLIY
jgi:hypothetical protein